MVVWEYAVVNAGSRILPQEYLNECGALGWELISVTAFDEGCQLLYTFKRPVSPPKENP